MKLEALRRSVARYFRRPATSVPPKIDRSPGGVIEGTKSQLDAIGDMIFKQLHEAGNLRPDLAKGLKPPLDTGTNGWTWSQWSKEAAGAGTIPGWAFCRFANRLGAENVGFVFGHVRGGFGVWRQPFDVCTSDHDGVQQRSEILTCVTHLQSGMGVGIFIDHATAIMAAELGEKVCAGWQTDLGHPYMDRVLTAWHGLGICQSSNAHAHDQHGTRFPIYGQDEHSVMAGKPERLS